MRKPKEKKLCEWCMKEPVATGSGQISYCVNCNPRTRYLQGSPQYRAFMKLYDMKYRNYRDACVAFLEAIVATSDQRWKWALQDHPDKMRRLALIGDERRAGYNRNGRSK